MDQLGGGGNRSDNQLNLRDFGPGRTLVLVNGLRRANFLILQERVMLPLTGTEFL